MVLPPFQRLLDEHAASVWRLCRALCPPDEAEDCFQETFVAALRNYGRLADDRNLRAWVMRIAQNKAMDVHRARRRRALPSAEVPERAAASRDGYDPKLWDAVRDLPPKQRAAVAHRFVVDLTYRDIASVMGTTEEAARQNVREGLKKLREVISRHE
jgi:RNA polymerase sigma factor (sigma-70 family)